MKDHIKPLFSWLLTFKPTPPERNAASPKLKVAQRSAANFEPSLSEKFTSAVLSDFSFSSRGSCAGGLEAHLTLGGNWRPSQKFTKGKGEEQKQKTNSRKPKSQKAKTPPMLISYKSAHTSPNPAASAKLAHIYFFYISCRFRLRRLRRDYSDT